VDDVKGLEVCFVWVWVSPDGDVRDEVWVCEGVVEWDKSFAWEDFVEMFECVDKGLEFPDDVGDVVVEFEVVLEDEAEEFGVWFVFKGGVADGEGDVRVGVWVECSVGCFGWVGNEVIGVEIVDEVVKVVLGVVFEGGNVGGRDDEGCIVGVGENG
jgi:hypothetical protein